MNLQMSMFGIQGTESFCNVQILGLARIHKLNQMIARRAHPTHQIIPRIADHPRLLTIC